MQKKQVSTFYPANNKAWRRWLDKNHQSSDAVWLVYYKRSSGKPSISWSDAVDEALCFGWIDSKAVPLDDEKFMHYFCKRKPKGTWSKINKDKIKRLTAAGLMKPAGLAVVAAAKKNGSWSILDEVEQLIIPTDLLKAFRKYPGSKQYFLSLSKSKKKALLQWLVLAKRPETREKRINEIVTLVRGTREEQGG